MLRVLSRVFHRHPPRLALPTDEFDLIPIAPRSACLFISKIVAFRMMPLRA
jgi:hypothetical protein